MDAYKSLGLGFFIPKAVPSVEHTAHAWPRGGDHRYPLTLPPMAQPAQLMAPVFSPAECADAG